MSQKRLKVLGRTLGHTPSLGVFCWLEVIDFDHFFGFLFLVFHVCYLTQGLPAYPGFAGRSSQKRNSFKKTAAIDSNGRTIWIADAHRDDGKRFIVRADDILTAFLELETAIHQFAVDAMLQHFSAWRKRFVVMRMKS